MHRKLIPFVASLHGARGPLRQNSGFSVYRGPAHGELVNGLLKSRIREVGFDGVMG